MRILVSYFFCFYCACFFLQAQEEPVLSFSAIREELFNGWISSIAQDSKGFIWIGTQDGLHRYDGYQFEVLRNSPENPQSLGANWIQDIAIDSNDDYWLATFGSGITKFSPKTMTFLDFSKDSTLRSRPKLSSAITTFGSQHIMSTTDEGFILLDIDNNTFKNLGIGAYKSHMTSNGDILWLIDKQRRLFHYSLETQKLDLRYTFDDHVKFLHYVPEIGLVIGFDDTLILFEDGTIKKEIKIEEAITRFTTNSKGKYIVGSANQLFKFYPKAFRLEKLHTDLDTSKFNIETLFLDRQGNLWVGTNKGLYKEKKFNSAFLPKKTNLHARRIIKKNKSLYIGGFYGLFKVEGEITTPLLSDTSILSMLKVGDTLYSSGDNAEVYQFFNDRIEATIPLSHDPNKKLRTMGLALDKQKRLWVGSWEGLHIFDKAHKLLKFVPLDTGFDSKEAKIINIYIDSKDRLWIITSAYGLFKILNVSTLDVEDVATAIVNYRSIKGDKNSLTCDIIVSLGEDEQGQMWFGTDIGVLKYQEETQNFARLQYQGKLFDKKVMSLRSSGDQNLWMTTIHDGIFKYNSADKTLRHFTKNDGLISNAFLYSSGFFDKDTQYLYFGTDEGVQQIDVSQSFLQEVSTVPVITAFTINGADEATGIPSPQAPFLKNISLSSDQNDFSVDFSAMDYTNPDKIRYSYALDTDDWRIADLQTAYFTNVPYGNHILKVRTIHDGITNNTNISQLNIFIKPPWYLSRFAKILYALFFVGAIMGIYTYLKWRWKMKFNLQLKEEEVVRFRKLNDFKSNLYTNIAHEFKTPLTLISGPVNHKLQEDCISDTDFDNFSMVKRNTERLTSLVDQVLELAKLENGKLQLQLSQGNLGLFFHSISRSFEYQARLKEIDYTVKIHSMDEIIYDADIVEKISTNLLSNAFKYCPEKGHCHFLVTKNATQFQIHVKNTTQKGFQPNMDKLFVRFYQEDNYTEGVGIGLALVKELVDFYEGTIAVKMEEGEIIHFQVSLPLYPENSGNTIIPSKASQVVEEVIMDTSSAMDTSSDIKEVLPILLVVEDHAEIRAFIKSALHTNYHILEAENGKIGHEIALAEIPDIILSDVHMPILNGIQLCNALKLDERTNHIPIILLTANSGEESELKGLESGADAFVTKPFKIHLLEQRISNLIGMRKALRDRYSQELLLKPKDISISPADEVFLNKIQEILDQHLANPEFNAASFCEKATMSRMQLHRKLIAYTGLSTSAFIRSQRLKQALQLLKNSDVTVNEVAYAVGFNTPSYFMKCFKETFKKTPSEYFQSTD